MSSAATRVTMLDRFERRTVLHLRLEATTAFRIGVGRSHDATTTDLPVLRDAAGVPVIPGSSLKGVVRSQIEALMRARNIEACDPFVAPCIGNPEGGDEQNADMKSRAAGWRAHVATACEACAIFGAPSLASHVMFSEARPVEGTEPVVRVRDGVGIDRDLGRVAGKLKYDFEVVEAGAQFEVRVRMDNLDHAQEGAVLFGLQLIEEGVVAIGGFTSRGLGVMRRAATPKVWEMTAERLSLEPLEWESWSNLRLAAFLQWMEKGVR